MRSSEEDARQHLVASPGHEDGGESIEAKKRSSVLPPWKTNGDHRGAPSLLSPSSAEQNGGPKWLPNMSLGQGRRRAVLSNATFTITTAALCVILLLSVLVPAPANKELYQEALNTVPGACTGQSYTLPSAQRTFLNQDNQAYMSRRCRLARDAFEGLQLTPTISYARRYVQQVPYEKEPPLARYTRKGAINREQQPLFSSRPQSVELDKVNKYDVSLANCEKEPYYLPMKKASCSVDASQHMFAVASTVDRLFEKIPPMSSWIAQTGATLVVSVPGNERMKDLEAAYRRSGIEARVFEDDSAFLFRYFGLIRKLHRSLKPETRWVTLIDDDTHYFDFRRLINTLAGHDHTLEKYIGAVSEDRVSVSRYGVIAFGGAGISLSVPLLEHLYERFDACLEQDRDPGMPGDMRLSMCIYQQTHAKLTTEPHLHQWDLYGESAGLLEGPSPPISLHHWATWSPLDVHLVTRAGEVCGNECLFQRWLFPRADALGYNSTSLHFGFSIVGYPPDVDPNFEQSEMTWEWHDPIEIAHGIAPVRDRLEEGKQRFTYRIAAVHDEPDGTVRQTFVMRRKGHNDAVLELFISR